MIIKKKKTRKVKKNPNDFNYPTHPVQCVGVWGRDRRGKLPPQKSQLPTPKTSSFPSH